MSYFVTEPSSALAAAVTGVWTLDMPRRHRIERVLPMASVEIIVNLADDYLLTGPDEGFFSTSSCHLPRAGKGVTSTIR